MEYLFAMPQKTHLSNGRHARGVRQERKPQANGDSTTNFELSSNAPILAIDLGKFNSMCSFFDPRSRELTIHFQPQP